MLDRMRPRFFSEYLHITQIIEMKEHGYFADLEYIHADFDSSGLRLNTTGGDYTNESVSIAIQNNDVLRSVKRLYERIETKGIIKHLLIFTQSVDDAFQLKNMIGKSCGVVSGTTPKKEREIILNDFKTGKNKSSLQCRGAHHGIRFS